MEDIKCMICGTVEAVVLVEGDDNGCMTPICEKCLYAQEYDDVSIGQYHISGTEDAEIRKEKSGG